MVVPRDSPIVGREREQAQLRQLLADAIAGHGSLVLVSGEAGIGKTTLVNDLIQHAKEQSCLVLTGGCYDLTTTPPYGPWVEAIGGYPGLDDRLPDLPEQLRQGSALTSVRSQTELLELVGGFLSAVSHQRPLVLVLEDLHWSDPASLELLRYLSRSLADSPVLLIITYRDDELTRQHSLFQILPPLIRETAADRIELQRLSSASIRDLATPTGLSEEDTYRLAAYLERRSGGNPLFATELLRALETDGAIASHTDNVQLGELDEDYLPSFVLQVIEQRLSRLDPEARRALEVAAVIGQDVPFDVWEVVSGVEQSALDTTIEQALATHILEETSDRQGLRFTHALIREVLYSGMIPTRRRAWHVLTAEILMAAPEPDPDAIAFHLDRAGDARLIDWLIRAGERAERRQARLMAADLFDRAQALLEGDPGRTGERAWLLFRTGMLVRFANFDRSLARLEESEALAKAAGQPVIMYLARAHKGLVECFQDEHHQGLADMRVGILALEDLDPADRETLDQFKASLSIRTGVQGRGTLGLLMAQAGYFGESKALLDEWPESEWEAAPDAYRANGFIYAALGQPALARQAFIRSQTIHESLRDPGQSGVDAYFRLVIVQIPYQADRPRDRQQLTQDAQAFWARSTHLSASERVADAILAVECFLSGNWQQADAHLGRQEWDSNFNFSFFGPFRLRLARRRGDFTTVWDAIRWKLPDGPESPPGNRNTYFVHSELQILAIEIALDTGQNELALEWLDANDRLLEWSGAVPGRSENQRLWARYHLLDEDLTASRQHATRAFEHASDPRQPMALLACHRFLGHLDTLDGRFADAEAHLQAALNLAAACQTPFERALTLLELARFRLAQHQPDEARRILAEVRAICEPLKAQPSLDRASALEAELQDRSAGTPFGLTPREFDVLRLVAEGMTDPEVAEQLFVSPRTVSSHLTSIYTKLGVSSRTAATRLAVEHGLL